MSLSVFAKPLNSLKFERKCLGPQEKKSKFFYLLSKKFPKILRFRDFPAKNFFDAQDDENDVDVDSSGK